MPGRVHTRRWNDPAGADDGLRILVSRFRPRGVPKADEPWDIWWKELGPSEALHADFYGKNGPPITLEQYRPRYLAEMKAQVDKIESIARRVKDGESVTLLCSSACVDEARCHRTLLKGLVEERLGPRPQPGFEVRRR